MPDMVNIGEWWWAGQTPPILMNFRFFPCFVFFVITFWSHIEGSKCMFPAKAVPFEVLMVKINVYGQNPRKTYFGTRISISCQIWQI